MRKTYSKPTLIRRECLADVAAGVVAVGSNVDQNGAVDPNAD